MKKILLLGGVASIALLLLSIFCLFCVLWLFPDMAMTYFGPAFVNERQRNLLYYIHPFIIGPCLLWLWLKLRSLFSGNTLVKCLKFGAFYMLVASLPYMFLIYSAIDVSLPVTLSWLVFGFAEAFISALVFSQVDKW